MSIDVFRAVVSAVVLLCAVTANADPAPDVHHVAPTLDAIDAAARRVEAAQCGTPACTALVSIAAVLHIDLDATASTVGIPRVIAPGVASNAQTALNQIVLNHPDQFAPICAAATDIVSRYAPPSSPGEVFVPVNLLHLALDMDARGGGHCLPTLLSALPRTPAAITAIRNAHQLCLNDKTLGRASCDTVSGP